MLNQTAALAYPLCESKQTRRICPALVSLQQITIFIFLLIWLLPIVDAIAKCLLGHDHYYA